MSGDGIDGLGSGFSFRGLGFELRVVDLGAWASAILVLVKHVETAAKR